VLLSLVSTPDNSRSPAYMEQVVAALHEATLPVTFEYASLHRQVGLFLRVSRAVVSAVRSAILARYPHCRLETVPSAALDPPGGFRLRVADLSLSPAVFPLRTHRQFDDFLERNTADPLAGLLAALSPLGRDGLWCKVQLQVVPARPGRCRRARRIVRRLSRPAFRRHPMLATAYLSAARSIWRRPIAWLLSCLTLAPDLSGRLQPHEREEQLRAAVAKLDRHLFSARLRITVAANGEASGRARRKIHEIAGAFGQFTAPGLSTFRLGPVRRFSPLLHPPRERGFLLSDEEFATLWHPATQTVRAETMAMNVSRELEPPANLPSKDEEAVAVLGRTAFRERRDIFGIRPDDRRRHVAIIGKTGMGKSTLLHRLILSDIEAGRGVAFIDPHGDLADSLLDVIPRHRTNDVVLFDAGDREHPVAYNPLACSDPAKRPLVASGVVSAFKKLYGESWGPRLEHILRNALLTLLEAPGSTLLSIRPLLTETGFRRSVLAHVQDAVVRAFWEHEFAKWKPNFQAEAVAPILNKVGQFMSHPILRGILDAPGKSLDLRRVMDDGRVLIVNLSKGRMGEDASMLLGSFIENVEHAPVAARHRAHARQRVVVASMPWARKPLQMARFADPLVPADRIVRRIVQEVRPFIDVGRPGLAVPVPTFDRTSLRQA